MGIEPEVGDIICPVCPDRTPVTIFRDNQTGDKLYWSCRTCGTKGYFREKDKIIILLPAA